MYPIQLVRHRHRILELMKPIFLLRKPSEYAYYLQTEGLGSNGNEENFTSKYNTRAISSIIIVLFRTPTIKHTFIFCNESLDTQQTFQNICQTTEWKKMEKKNRNYSPHNRMQADTHNRVAIMEEIVFAELYAN